MRSHPLVGGGRDFTPNIYVMRRTLVAIVGLATLLTTASPVEAQVPAGAFTTGNVTRIADLNWKTRSGHYVSRWTLSARQMATAQSWLGLGGVSTWLYIGELRCLVVDGKKESCSTGVHRSWELEPGDFEFDPFLERAEVTFGSNDRRIVWVASGDRRPRHSLKVREKRRADTEHLWGEARSSGHATVSRKARVSGRIAGFDLATLEGEASIFVWVGSYTSAGYCLVDAGSICT